MSNMRGDGSLLSATIPSSKQHYTVLVHIIEARGLVSKNSDHVPDALCRLELGPTTGVRALTSLQEKTLNPVWDQIFKWEIELEENEFEGEKIGISVVNKHDFLRNELIGSYEFSLTNIYRQKHHQYLKEWVPLYSPEKPENEEGWLLCTVYVLRPLDPTPPNTWSDPEQESSLLTVPGGGAWRQPYVLNVFIYSAGELLQGQLTAAERNAKKAPNVTPFVQVRFNSNTSMTQKDKSGTSERVWNTRFEMPYTLPLRSDAIEITVWNDPGFMLAPSVIAKQIFNFFELGLANQEWGPRWVNLYSNIQSPRESNFLPATNNQHEYVGRLLMRMTVEAKDEALLVSVPCAPARAPPSSDYTLQFLLYSASELPVQGGKVFIEIVFGALRQRCEPTYMKANASGVYEWFHKFPPMSVTCPDDRTQTHSVFINVYQQYGGVVKKIAYEQIAVSELIPSGPGPNSFYINRNFVVNKSSKLSQWPAMWRTLSHVRPDPSKPQVSAGFLLCSIGYGFKQAVPRLIPEPKLSNFQKYILRGYIQHGANLMAADGVGSSNPVLNMKFAGVSKLLKSQKNTVFPLWFEMVELTVYIQPELSPSLYLQVFHEGMLQYTSLGRCEISANDIMQNQAKLQRYRIRYDQDVQLKNDDTKQKSKEFGKNYEDFQPYILAAFELFPYADRLDHPEIESLKTPQCRDVIVRVEMLGLRDMIDACASPNVELSVPKLPWAHQKKKDEKKIEEEKKNEKDKETNDIQYEVPKITRDKQIFSCTPPARGNSQILAAANFVRVSLPITDPYSIPLRIRLFDDTTCVASRFIPISELLTQELDIPRPPTYKFNPKKNINKTDSLKSKMMGPSVKLGDNTLDDTLVKTLPKQMLNELNDMPKEYEHLQRELDDDEAVWAEDSDDEKQDLAPILDPTVLELDNYHLNMHTARTHGNEANGKEWKNDGNTQQQTVRIHNSNYDDDEDASDSEEKQSSFDSRPPLRLFSLFKSRGRNAYLGLGRVFDVASPYNQIEACVLKCFARCVLIREEMYAKQLDEFKRSDLLQPIKSLYSTRYIARLYVYKGINLSPKDGFLSQYQSSNPYLIVTNGEGQDHYATYESKAKTDDLNPDFYQIVQLSTQLPENNRLEIQVWNKELTMDDLIGVASIDLEARLLKQQDEDWEAISEHVDLWNDSAKTSQGKLSIKLEILTEDEARRTKPDDIQPQQSNEYEVRMVIWSTRDVRFPLADDAHGDIDDVNQRIIVTANFENKKGGSVEKLTDVAWGSVGGRADWNYRMKWRTKIPCKLPRLKIAIWNETVMTSNSMIGEALYNLQPFFNKCLRDPKPVQHADAEWVPVVHPEFAHLNLGAVNIEFWLLTESEADKSPVGEAQNEPNRDPFLRDPKRNLPPWAVMSKGLAWFAARKKLIMIILILCLVVPATIPIIIFAAKAAG